MVDFKIFKTAPGAAFMKLTFGNMGSQIIQIVALPFILNFYTPEQFALYAIYSAVVAILVTISTGRYEMAVIIPKDVNKAKHLVVLSCAIATAFSIALLIIGFCMDSIFGISHKFHIFLWTVPCNVLSLGIVQSFQYWFNRKNQFKLISQLRITHTLLNSIGMLLCGIYTVQDGLIFSLLFAGVGNLIVILFLYLFNNYKISPQTLYCLIFEYKDYPIKSLVGVLTNSLSYNLENFLFPYLFGLYSTGNYFFANRLLNTLKIYTSNNIWQVFINEIAGKSKADILKCMEKYQEKLILYFTLPMFSFIILMCYLWPIFFSEKWQDALGYFIIISVFIYSNIVVASFSLFLPLNRPDAEMHFNLLMFTIKFIFIGIAYSLDFELLVVIIGITVLQSFLFFLLGSWNYRQLMNDKYYFIKKFFNLSKFFLPFLICIFGSRFLFDNVFIMIIVLFIVNYAYFNFLGKKVNDNE